MVSSSSILLPPPPPPSPSGGGGAPAPDPGRGVADREDGVFVVDPPPLTPSPFWRGGTSAPITVIDPAIVDPLPGVAVYVEQPVLVGLFRADRPAMQRRVDEVPGVLVEQGYALAEEMRGAVAAARGKFPFRFGGQAISCAMQVVGGQRHAGSDRVGIDPLVFGNSRFGAEPVAVLRRLVPGDGELRARRVRHKNLRGGVVGPARVHRPQPGRAPV